MSTNDGGPAFPRGGTFLQKGMTLRDWFAGQALGGMIAGGAHEGFGANECADASYQFSDAMLAQRNKED